MTLRCALLLIALAASGCDRITGAGEKKTLDAEAIGYACRVSSKAPADCISDNETHSPTSLLAGWKAADADILAKVLDPSMGSKPEMAAHPKSAAAHPAGEATDEASASKKGASSPEDTTGPTPEKTEH